jgi:LPS export ABC transporter protein LptC/lipopolysaccharide transport protein LptA
MNTWQRRARLALAVFVVVFAAGLFFALRREPAKPQAPPITRTDPNAAVESTGGVAIQLKGDKEEFKVESQESLVYANGMRKLKHVKVTVAERAGRSFVLTADEAKVGESESAIEVNGHVALSVSDGLNVTTEQASYTEGDGVVRAAGPVEFRRGRLAGSGVGMTYDKNRDVLWLLDQAVVEVAADDTGSGASRVRAGAAGLARQDKYMRFERGVRVLRAGRALEADTAVAYLSDDEKRIQRVELRGGSRIVGGGRTPGALEAMSARDMDLTYGAEGEILQQAILAGGAVIQIAGDKGTRGRRIAGEWMDIGLAPDGTTVTSLQGRDNIQLDLPPEGGAPGRTVHAAALQATGTPATGLTNAAFQADPASPTSVVEFRERQTAKSPARVAHARSMGLALKPGFGQIETARFGGGVRFDDGDLTATAREARYIVSAGQLNLSGDDERTGRPPQVVDPKATISGARIEVVFDGRKITAQGSVDTVRQPSAAAPAGTKPGALAAEQGDHLPALFKQDQPAYVRADDLAYDGGAGRAIYTGTVRLWQGDLTINGDRVVLDDRKGDLTATGSVRSHLVMLQENETTKAKEKVPTIGAAESLVYEDATRKIVLARGPSKQARLAGAEGDVTADRIDLFLNKAGEELERLEADGEATIKLPQNRTASGTHLKYTAADGRYVMNGSPVRIIEECRETTGRTLTFFRSTDRITADGNEVTRTQTKSGGKCSEPRLD